MVAAEEEEEQREGEVVSSVDEVNINYWHYCLKCLYFKIGYSLIISFYQLFINVIKETSWLHACKVGSLQLKAYFYFNEMTKPAFKHKIYLFIYLFMLLSLYTFLNKQRRH